MALITNSNNQSISESLSEAGYESESISQYVSDNDFLSSTTSTTKNKNKKTQEEEEEEYLQKSYPIVANERCGTWYAKPFVNNMSSDNTACYSTHFKSTDGHVNIYNFSFKRMNLKFLYAACTASNKNDGAIFIIDGSKSKIQPDSFSRTLPIWCCVLNRLVLEFREKQNIVNSDYNHSENCNDNDNNNENGNNTDTCDNHGNHDNITVIEEWDTNLYTPSFIVSDEEHDTIMDVIPQRVQSALDSGVILNEELLIQTLIKPLRCFWINNNPSTTTYTNVNANEEEEKGEEKGEKQEQQQQQDWKDLFSTIEQMKSKYTCIICVSVSESGVLKNVPHHRPATRPCFITTNNNNKDANEYDDEHEDAQQQQQQQQCMEKEWYYYTPGAADDHELGSWSKGLTPALFWKHCNDILFQKDMSIEDTDQVISNIMKQVEYDRNYGINDDDDDGESESESQPIINFFDTLDNCNISIGSRKSGRPPYCWDHFDAILNVTELEYENCSSRQNVMEGKYYLQLNVKEGKKDRTELEKWMAVAIMFIGIHAAASNRRVLVHCAQGEDRSVAVVLAAICSLCRLTSSSSPIRSNNNMSSSSSNNDITLNNGRKELVFHPWCAEINIESLSDLVNERDILNDDDDDDDNGNTSSDETDKCEYGCSGIPTYLVNSLIGRPGKDLLFHYLRRVSMNGPNGLVEEEENDDDDDGNSKLFGTKESLRLALIAIQQYRDEACPSRKTMQKLNRFFMSNLHE